MLVLTAANMVHSYVPIFEGAFAHFEWYCPNDDPCRLWTCMQPMYRSEAWIKYAPNSSLNNALVLRAMWQVSIQAKIVFYHGAIWSAIHGYFSTGTIFQEIWTDDSTSPLNRCSVWMEYQILHFFGLLFIQPKYTIFFIGVDTEWEMGLNPEHNFFKNRKSSSFSRAHIQKRWWFERFHDEM